MSAQDTERAAALERRYSRLLRCYPPAHRQVHREEMLGVLLATARPGQRAPGARQTVNLVACGLAIRARRALSSLADETWQDALAVVSLIAPVLMLTAFSQRELVERARDAGAMAYLVKPFTKADLVPAIEMAVSRYTEIRALDEEVSTLKDRLEVRKLLDRAKGLLQSEHGMSEPQAFRWIQKTSMDRRLTMRKVAEAVIEGTLNATANKEEPEKPE